jgi:hypothetical protein
MEPTLKKRKVVVKKATSSESSAIPTKEAKHAENCELVIKLKLFKSAEDRLCVKANE